MIRAEPYEPRGLDPDNPLPFYLYWPQDERYADSAFGVTAEELEAYYPEAFRAMGEQTRAILIGGELMPVPKFGEGMNLIVSQYWRGHMVRVILGVHAPSTLAITQFVADRKVTESLGEYRYNEATNGSQDDCQPILIHKFKTTITRVKQDSSVPDTSVVTKIAPVAATPSSVAVISASPSPTTEITPSPSTVATAWSEDVNAK